MKIDRIKFMILQGDMNQQEMADRIGVSRVTINKISRRGRCSRETFLKILQTFDIEPEEIVAEDY